MVRNKHPYSHVPLNEPNYSETNKAGTLFPKPLLIVYIFVQKASGPPDSTQIYSSFQLPTLNITPRKNRKFQVCARKQEPSSHLYATGDRKEFCPQLYSLELKNNV